MSKIMQSGQLPHLILLAKDTDSLVRGLIRVHLRNTIGAVLPLAVLMAFAGPATPLDLETFAIWSGNPLELTGLVILTFALASISAYLCHLSLIGAGLSFGLDVNAPGAIALIVTTLIAFVDVLFIFISYGVALELFGSELRDHQAAYRVLAAVLIQFGIRVFIFGALAFASWLGLCGRIPRLEGNHPRWFLRI